MRGLRERGFDFITEQVMNLRPPNEAQHSNWWEEIGVWKSEAGGKVLTPLKLFFSAFFVRLRSRTLCGREKR